ncbi:MAG TPA: hypothetical protein VGN82_07835 [Bosea sp. (in: a-proteobacteria)]|jgi:hypothetical protein|uniref:hypothetical protein n=1 Tax=Bosea sp. (in: a-proteobacteria) TaxID=1871050 RepID=UPI002E0EE3D0|nr:hypothetical protein [Bosea sp. (in: a-proteobacteria)]
MTGWFDQLRHHLVPRAAFLARGSGRPPRASSIICGMTAVMLLLAILAKALIHLLTAI